MRVVALLDVLVGELNLADFVGPAFTCDGANLELVPLNRDDIEIVQINRVPGVGDDRAYVAGEKILVLSTPENERATAAGADNEIGDIAMHQSDAVSSDDLLQRRADGCDQARFVINRRSGTILRSGSVVEGSDQMSEDFS